MGIAPRAESCHLFKTVFCSDYPARCVGGRFSARTGWPSVSILWVAVLIFGFYVSEAACTIVEEDL